MPKNLRKNKRSIDLFPISKGRTAKKASKRGRTGALEPNLVQSE